jgi:hypothetical protein
MFTVHVGLSFGAYVVLFPVLIATVYGAKDFGKYFAYLVSFCKIYYITALE